MKKSQVSSVTFLNQQLVVLLCIICQLVSCQQQQQQAKQRGPFPGVSKDLASFCAARPSLPIDLASMIVHVKRNVSFNYKLYLFSGDHVFQTGQVIPRDDFRVHTFPVKAKTFQEFWPSNLSAVGSGAARATFDLKEFFRLVPLDEPRGRKPRKAVPDDASGEPLPGDHHPEHHEPFISHDVAHVVAERQRRRQTSDDNMNKFIEFDRDDQISRLNLSPDSLASTEPYLRSPESHASSSGSSSSSSSNKQPSERQPAFEQLVLPVGSFSSFHVNLTYLVRKDFDQLEPQLVRVLVDANKFQVSEWEVVPIERTNRTIEIENQAEFGFLSHKLLRDVNTRITSINQIYEDWITRNFYTIVYVQRRLVNDHDHDHDDRSTNDDMIEGEAAAKQATRIKSEPPIAASNSHRLINDRLVFRGSSSALLGADQLDHQVKASAFITEKNGLHYYIEFLNTGKFYLCAVDWQKRPFKIIDWQQFPIKATRTQYDNEELLLCPPAVCYSSQPIDEIVSYGRLNLAEQIQRQLSQLSSSSSLSLSLIAGSNNRTTTNHQIQNQKYHQLINDTPISLSISVANDRQIEPHVRQLRGGRSASVGASLDQIIEAVMITATKSETEVRLHLRDWVWTLATAGGGIGGGGKLVKQPGGGFGYQWRYEQAKRNDIKAKQDAYGYTLAGHEIDASYRIYNELYLISANHLIAINYTLSNETVVSSIPVGEEFPGLISSLIDPITGAFYDRYTNRVYFFKGDRYIGFDYATKKPLEEFVLKPSYLHSALWGDAGLESSAAEASNNDGPQILASQPVVGLLGRQHQVDAVYHDLPTDSVYIFTGMKFYVYQASEFKDGAFRSKTGELPQMHCINERFLDGCTFDKAYPNPCEESHRELHQSINAKLRQAAADHHHDVDGETVKTIEESLKDFNQEQQMKLRTIASKAGLLNVLVENSLIGKSIRTLEPLISKDGDQSLKDPDRDQEKLVIYLLMAVVVVTILVTILMILVMISSTSTKRSSSSRAQQAVLNQLSSVHLSRHGAEKVANSQVVKRTSNHYLSNQHQSRLRPYHVPTIPQASVQARPKSGSNIVMSKTRMHRDDIDNSVL